MNAFELFRRALERKGDHAALVTGVGGRRTQLTFRELNAQVDSVAGQFAQSGLQPGDKVLLAVPLSIETFVVMLALLRTGMVIMLIEPAHGAAQVASILRSWPPAAIVASKSLLLLRHLVPELRRIGRRFVVGHRSAGAMTLAFHVSPAERHDVMPRSAADSAFLTFTSGSTGNPKPVLRTHGFLRQQLCVLDPVADMQDSDIDFVAMPMFVLFNLARGITSIIPACDMKHPGRADPRIILEQLRRDNATRIVASPALLERLAAYCLGRGQCLSHMRRFSTGGGPVSPDLPARLCRIAPAATVCMVYGSSEAEPIAALLADEINPAAQERMRAGGGLLVGKPVPGCDVRIIRTCPGTRLGPLAKETCAHLCCPPGSIGEIIVSGKHVLTAYADPARNGQSKIEIGNQIWHRTGDAGYLDAGGRLWLVGRCDAAVTDDLGTVYPFQVEYALSAIRGVRRAALLARDRKRVLVLEMSGRDLRAACRDLARCMLEHHIEQVVTLTRIPLDKRHGAKIDYPALNKVLDGRWFAVRWRLATSLSRIVGGLRNLRRRAQNWPGSARSTTGRSAG